MDVQQEEIMKKFFLTIPPLLIAGVMMMHCSGTAVNLQESYQKLSPQKPVEYPEPAEDNLIVTIANIADDRSSYKNRIEIYVNQKKIEPNWVRSNLDRKNVYSMRLKPGFYDLQAVYYATVGWGEEKFVISNPGLISVLPEQRTMLTCTLAKNSNGTPLNKNPHFALAYQPLGPIHSPTPLAEANEKKTAAVVEANPTRQEVEGADTYLQINTIPENARVYVDDKLAGQSPVRVKVDATVDHAVQISADGYKTVVKYLDRKDLKAGSNFLLIELQN